MLGGLGNVMSFTAGSGSQTYFWHVLGHRQAQSASGRKNSTFSAGTGLQGVKADPHPRTEIFGHQWGSSSSSGRGVKPRHPSPGNRTLPPPGKRQRKYQMRHNRFTFSNPKCTITPFRRGAYGHSTPKGALNTVNIHWGFMCLVTPVGVQPINQSIKPM